MTVATTSGGATAPWSSEDLGDLGMEDIKASELTIPRLELVHDQAAFRDRNSKAEFETLNCIILGVVKQRIMWDKEVDDGDQPQCKSPSFEVGFPQMRTDIPKEKQFPWASSNFNPADFPPGDDGLVRLPCEKCVFQEWNVQGWKNPPCAEQFTFPLLYDTGDGDFSPAILTLQRSAAKACKQYITSFKNARQPMFTVNTQLTLTLQSRGKVKYSTPNFKRLGPTDNTLWSQYADDYRSIREFLRQDPRPRDEDGGTTSRPVASATKATTLEADDPWSVPTPRKPADDDLPF